MGQTPLRLRRYARAKLLELGVVGDVPRLDAALATEELVGRIVPAPPFEVPIGEVIEPLLST
jgi:hypothetical protein